MSITGIKAIHSRIRDSTCASLNQTLKQCTEQETRHHRPGVVNETRVIQNICAGESLRDSRGEITLKTFLNVLCTLTEILLPEVLLTILEGLKFASGWF
eukprot:6412889-Amphidinium_carterae.1